MDEPIVAGPESATIAGSRVASGHQTALHGEHPERGRTASESDGAERILRTFD